MSKEVHTIHAIGVNCYLVQTEDSYFLIDTGLPYSRKKLLSELDRLGVKPGNLRLILITHGDMDHIGNAALLRQKYAAKIAMHAEDSGMAEFGDMDWSRKKSSNILRKIIRIIFRVPKSDRFKADVYLEDGQELSEYGWEARVVHLPGHSKGSIGVLTSANDLFCGDMFMNEKSGPHLGFGDPAEFQPSLEKLERMQINTVYPGHGEPFRMEALEKQ